MAKGPTLTVTLLTDDKMSGGLSSASASVEGFGKKVSGFAIGAGAAVTTMAVSAIPQIVDLAGQMVGLGQQAELFRTKSKTVFGSSAGDISQWADSVNESFGLSDEAVVGLAAGMGDLLVPMGFARDEAAKMTKETVGVAGALSAWSGGAYDTAEVTDILTKAMLGERDGLKALGISINQAEVDQRAMEIAQKDGRTAITEQDKALATQQLIFEKSADAQKAWADGSMDAVKNQNELKATIEDVKTSIGTALLPMVQQITAWFGDEFIPKVRELVATFQEKWPEIRAAIEPTLVWIQETVAAVVEFVQALWEQFGDRILTHAQNVWKYIREGIESAMLIIKGVIDLVTGIISGDWGKAWDGIKGIVKGVWDGITNLIRFALQNIGLLLDVAWENIKGAVGAAWEGIKSLVSLGFDALVETARGLPGRMAGLFSGMFDGIKSAFRGALNWVIDRWNGLEFKMPSFSAFGKEIGGFTVGVPDIPRFHSGGIVPQTPSGEMLALLQSGERVIPASGAGGGGNTVVNVTVNGADPNMVVSAIRKYVRANGPLTGLT
jgi:hypothetical protein